MAAAAAAAGPLLGLAGAATSTIGNVMADDVQAKGLQAQARSIEDQTAFEGRQFARSAKIQAGSNNATMAASGLDITRGSPLFQQLDFAKQSEIQAQSIKRGGQIEANNARFQASMARRKIPFDIISGVTQGASVLTQLAGK